MRQAALLKLPVSATARKVRSNSLSSFEVFIKTFEFLMADIITIQLLDVYIHAIIGFICQ
jgi:hypothetical protein